MDVSRVGRCRSDFSIDRILSEDPRRENDEVPNWLCCTRYRPPRLPRSTSSACRARRSGRHARVPFTAAQAAALEAAYARAPYLAPPALRALAAALQLRDDRIKIWFQNRRARERREKTTTIAPPSSVTLPATPRVHPPQTRWIPYTNTIHSTPRDFLTDNSTHEDAAIDSGMAYDLTVTPLPFHSQSRSPSNDSERSETPLDIESIDE